MRAGLAMRRIGLAALLVIGAGTARAQTTGTLQGPVNALRLEGDRLLIGQHSALVEARLAGDDLRLSQVTDLKRHDIRSIAVSQGITLALSEDGLTALDASGQILDFVGGGGQRLAASGGRVFVAAREAGVRILSLAAGGKLAPLGAIRTAGPALDLATEGDTALWVAEGDQGVRLYDTANPQNSTPLVWLGDLAPATAVRAGNLRLYVGHGNQLSILDIISVKAPRLLGRIEVEDSTSRINDLVVQPNRVLVARAGGKGPDVLALDVSNSRAITLRARYGEQGAGEWLAARGDEVFVGSAGRGLQRLRLGQAGITFLENWEPHGQESPCAAGVPTSPRPAHLSEVPDGPVQLDWRSGCATSYEIRINGQIAATLPAAASGDGAYSLTPRQGLNRWQVTAIDAAGNRAVGPTWHFESPGEGWLATPGPVPQPSMLYAAPPRLELNSPGAVLLATCSALCLGLGLILAAAWLLGDRARRRAPRPEWRL